MAKVVVIGGGVAGCAAALTARKAGAEVTLVERLDILGGAAKRAGRIKNGDYTAIEEARALGAGDLFDALQSITLHHTGIAGENPAFVYDCGRVDLVFQRVLEKYGVKVLLGKRAVDVEKKGGRISAVKLSDGEVLKADSFVDTTGDAGGFPVCVKYGRGCVMCLYKCPAFGDRVSVATLAGAPEKMFHRPNGTPGSVGAAIAIFKQTLSKELQRRLEKEGTILIPLPPEFVEFNLRKLKNEMSAPRTEEQMKTVNLVNIGPVAKLVAIGYVPLPMLRSIPGFEEAEVEDPRQPGYNQISGVSVISRHDSLQVEDFDNLYVAGTHSGFFGGITDCLSTGLVAGHNAARTAFSKKPIVLPRTLLLGDFIAYQGEFSKTSKGFGKPGGFAAGAYYDRIQKTGLFTLDAKVIQGRVKKAGLLGVFQKTPA